MRLCLVNAFYDRDIPHGDALIERYFNVRELAKALGDRGHEVQVVQLFHRHGVVERDGVGYHFVTAGPPWTWVAAAAAGLTGKADRTRFLRAPRLAATLSALNPEVVHFNGLTLEANLAVVGRWCQARGVPLTASFHGGFPARRRVMRRWQRRTLARAGRLMFTTLDHAAPWLEAGVIGQASRVTACMETSSFFESGDRTAARAATGLSGTPVFLWAGRLDAIKDPMTALAGFRLILKNWPEARLYMAYLDGDLLGDVIRRVENSSDLRAAVTLLGRIDFARMADYFNAADFFLQASHREFGGSATLEASACGCIPVVSDIPSFRAMTDDGRLGVLFPVGDAEALGAGVVARGRGNLEARSDQVVAHFKEHLSYPAMAKTYESAFLDLLEASGKT